MRARNDPCGLTPFVPLIRRSRDCGALYATQNDAWSTRTQAAPGGGATHMKASGRVV